MEETVDNPLAMGASFSDISDVARAVQEYQELNNVKLRIQDCVTFGRAFKDFPGRYTHANVDLKYSTILYACIRGRRSDRAPDILPCPMRIRLSLSACGQNMVVTKVCEMHNHDNNEEHESFVYNNQAENTVGNDPDDSTIVSVPWNTRHPNSSDDQDESILLTNSDDCYNPIFIGATFFSLEDVSDAIGHYSVIKNVPLRIRDSSTIEKAFRRNGPRRVLNARPELKYVNLIYMCNFGGKRNKIPCQMKIQFSLSANGQNLVVRKLMEKHNHAIEDEIPQKGSAQKKKHSPLEQDYESNMNADTTTTLFRSLHQVSSKRGSSNRFNVIMMSKEKRVQQATNMAIKEAQYALDTIVNDLRMSYTGMDSLDDLASLYNKLEEAVKIAKKSKQAANLAKLHVNDRVVSGNVTPQKKIKKDKSGQRDRSGRMKKVKMEPCNEYDNVVIDDAMYDVVFEVPVLPE